MCNKKKTLAAVKQNDWESSLCGIEEFLRVDPFIEIRESVRSPSELSKLPWNQIIVCSGKGRISVVRGAITSGDFEIYCIEGDLFEDIERYRNVGSCGRRIIDILGVTK